MTKLVAERTKSRIKIKNEQDLNPVFVDRKFGRPEDYIEVYITDLNEKILGFIPNYMGYQTGQSEAGLVSEINIDPLTILNNHGFFTGRFKLKINIQKKKIFNEPGGDKVFRIKEISSTKTELKLRTTISNKELENNSRVFIQAVQNSTYFRDFNLSFGDNINVTAVNIDLDKTDSNQFLLNIKLLKPLPQDIQVGDRLSICEDITEPIEMTYDLGSLPTPETGIPIKGPNYKIDTRLNAKVPTAFQSYDNILNTSATSSYKKLLVN